MHHFIVFLAAKVYTMVTFMSTLKQIGIITLLIVSSISLLGFLKQFELIEMFLTAVALAVSAKAPVARKVKPKVYEGLFLFDSNRYARYPTGVPASEKRILLSPLSILRMISPNQMTMVTNTVTRTIRK